MTQTDDRILLSEPMRFDQPADRRWWWWPIAALGAVTLIVGIAVGRVTSPSNGSDQPAEQPKTVTATDVLEPGPLLGGIGGAHRYPTGKDGVEHMNFAWPGEELTAPEPSTGEAVGWQWELCDVPPEPDKAQQVAPNLECRAVSDATEDRWSSPATNRTRLVRVIVTVDLGDGVRIKAAAEPVAAVDWPANIKPGDPPSVGFPDKPPAR